MNVTRVYPELWFRTPDCKLIEVKDEADIAYASGLSVRRSKERVNVLKELGFIKIRILSTQRLPRDPVPKPVPFPAL